MERGTRTGEKGETVVQFNKLERDKKKKEKHYQYYRYYHTGMVPYQVPVTVPGTSILILWKKSKTISLNFTRDFSSLLRSSLAEKITG